MEATFCLLHVAVSEIWIQVKSNKLYSTEKDILHFWSLLGIIFWFPQRQPLTQEMIGQIMLLRTELFLTLLCSPIPSGQDSLKVAEKKVYIWSLEYVTLWSISQVKNSSLAKKTLNTHLWVLKNMNCDLFYYSQQFIRILCRIILQMDTVHPKLGVMVLNTPQRAKES